MITANKGSWDAISVFNQALTYGVGGNPDGLVEYIGHAAPGSSTSEARWFVKKLKYDASQRLINIYIALDANNQASFTQIFDNAATLNYGT